MDNKYEAHKKSYRIQQAKTYGMRVFLLPKWILGGTAIIVSLIAWKTLGNMIKSSNNKLVIQKENYKPVKRTMKLDRKQIKKELKNEVIIIEEVDIDVQSK